MAKKHRIDHLLVGKHAFKGKAEMNRLLAQKISGEIPVAIGGAKLTMERVATAREHLRRQAVLRKIALEERLSLLAKFPLAFFIDHLPKRLRNSQAISGLTEHKNQSACLAAIERLSRYLRRNYYAGQFKRRDVVVVLEKLLFSNVPDDIKKKVVETLSKHNIEESKFVLKWVSAQENRFSAEVRKQAAEAAKKLHSITTGK